MKTIKRLWTIVCLCLCTLACAFGITFNNVKASAATAVDVTIDYACIQYTANDGTGVPKTYTFVTNLDGASASARYNTNVYVDGEKMDAWMEWGCFYIDANAFDCAVGDTFLLEIPAGTYYQTNAYVASDIKVFMTLTNSYTDPDSGAYNKQGILNRTNVSNIISTEPFTVQMNRKDWAMNASNTGNFYLSINDSSNIIKSGVATEDWSNGAKYSPIGNAVTVNGTAINKQIQKVYADPSEDAYMQITGVSKPGDVLAFEGWFYNATYGAFYVGNSSFIYDGKTWDEANSGTYSFEVSTTSDANPQKGFYLSMGANHIPVSAESSGWAYQTVPVGKNHYGTINGTSAKIRLTKFSATDWYVTLDDAGHTAVAGDVLTFGGWYQCNDGTTIHFIKINKAAYKFDGTKWTEVTPTYNVTLKGSEVSGDYIYVTPGQSVSDIVVTASNGNAVTMNFVEAVKDNKFVLRTGESTSEYLATFSVADEYGTIFTKRVSVRVGFEDFVMENGAAVRVVNDSVNGLRFSAEMSSTTYNNLKAQGATFGMVIVPRDYVTTGYELTAVNLFGVNAKYSTAPAASQKLMLKLDGLTPTDNDKDGRYEIYGSITDILTQNLTREFVGIAYVCVNGEYIVAAYSGNDMENNARSIYYVSQRAVDADDHATAVTEKYINVFEQYLNNNNASYNVTYTVNHIKTNKGVTEVETETYTAALNSKVTITAKEYDGYTLTSFVSSITGKIYANKNNVFDFYYKNNALPSLDTTAWHHPDLDDSNNYMNETNKAIAETMSLAGFTSVMLNGSHTVGDVYLNSPTNIETMKNIINMFWTYGGITTYVSGKNAGATSEYVSLEDYKALQAEMATLLDCEGFGGFFAWDEPLPNAASFERIAEYAEWFDGLYGDEATFMVNLFPSYYADWASGEYKSYAAYIQAYCDIVLPEIEVGTKYLSMDSYPVYADGTLMQNYMYDMAVLKHFALEYGAQANAILQACGWNSTKNNKAPNEAQYRLLAYTALAFGMDSIGWWGYSPESENPTVILPGQTPANLDNTTTAAYDAIKAVNAEVAGFGSIYKTYNWQGVIMSSPSYGLFGYGKDAQYDAFNMVKSDSLLSKYMLSASNTNAFSSISGSGSNYVVSVMKDNNNNEAFTAVNYSAPKDNKTLSLTFKANTNGQYTIYKNGESYTVDITTSGYTLTLAPGEGAFIVSANTVHTVTFKNWDGTVLYETTCNIGETPVYNGVTPSKVDHEFAGWTPAIGAIKGDTVYTATFTARKAYTVTYANYDGTTATKSDAVEEGDKVTYVPTLDGYIFAGWMLNGEPYNMNNTVTSDMTLVAKWYKALGDGVDEVLSAQYIYDNVTLEDGYAYKEVGATANPNSGWYFDADYNGNSGAGGTDDNKFMNWATFTLTYDGGAGTNATGRETYLILPAMNYKLYSKVDFAYTNNANIKALTIYGTEVSQFGGNNKLISVVTDASGTKIYFREINSATGDVTKNAQAVITVPESVANGSEGLRLNITVGGWFRINVTEFHATKGVEDYKATMAEMLAILEADPSDEDAMNAYVTAKSYMTAYELRNYVEPEVITIAQEYVLYNTILNTEAGSADQMAAIKEYTAFVEANPAVRNEDHIAEINAIIYANFYETEDVVVQNVVSIMSGGQPKGEMNIAINGNSKFNGTKYQSYSYRQNSSGTDLTFTLGNYNYAACTEVRFGVAFAVTGGVGSLTVGGVTMNVPEALVGHFYNMEAVIENGYLTLVNFASTNDVKDNAIGYKENGYFLRVKLSDEILSGASALTFVWQMPAAYGWFEITEMHATQVKTMSSSIASVASIISGGQAKGEMNLTHAQNAHSKFNGTKYERFSYRQNSSGTDLTFTLYAMDYNAYTEVRFGIAFAVTGGVGSLTIDGATMNVPEALVGHFYNMEAVIANGYLTLIDFASTNDVKNNAIGYSQNGYFLRVKLSDRIMNGTEALKLEWLMPAAYGWFEVTEIHASQMVQIVTSAVYENEATVDVNGTSGNNILYSPASNWGTSAKMDFQTATYTNINFAQFSEAATDYTVTYTLPKFNFSQYNEAYFGFTAATAKGNASVTINGTSYTYDLNDGYYYVKMMVKGNTLMVIGDGASNLGQVLMTVQLTAGQINGTEALTIQWTTAGWSQVEITEIHTSTVVNPLA